MAGDTFWGAVLFWGGLSAAFAAWRCDRRGSVCGGGSPITGYSLSLLGDVAGTAGFPGGRDIAVGDVGVAVFHSLGRDGFRDAVSLSAEHRVWVVAAAVEKDVVISFASCSLRRQFLLPRC